MFDARKNGVLTLSRLCCLVLLGEPRLCRAFEPSPGLLIGPREVRGDGLGGTVSTEGPPRSSARRGRKVPEQVQVCFQSVLQKDHLGVKFATCSYALLQDAGLLTDRSCSLEGLRFGVLVV